MTTHTHAKLIGSTVTALFVAQCAFAQVNPPSDLPAVSVPGTCKSLDFNRALLSEPVRVDLVAQVSEEGRALSVSAITPVENSALLAAAISSVMTCRFQPAMKGGRTTSGVARLLYTFTPAVAATPLARRPAIGDIPSCAPTSDDYPEASRRLNETGTTRVGFTVDPQGRLTAFGVVRSSGHFRLDFTALAKLTQCRFRPGTAADGTPVSASFEVDYIWKLE